MSYFSLAGLLIFITSLYFAILVFWKSKDNKANKIWALFCLSVAVWGFGSFKIGQINNPKEAMLWWKIAHIGIIINPVFFWNYISNFLKINKRIITIIIYIVGIYFVILDVFTNILISNVRWVFNSFYYDSPPNLAYYFFVIFFFLVIIYAHYELVKNYQSVKQITKARIKYFFIATSLGFIGGLTAFLPVFRKDFYPYLNFTVPLYPIIMTYAIVRHRLMDIKLVLRKSTVLVLSLLTIFVPAFMTMIFFAYYIGNFSIWPNFFILIIGVLIYPIIRDYYFQLANKYLFSSLYDSVQVVSEVSNGLKMILNVNKAYQFIDAVFTKIFHIKSFYIFITDAEGEKYVIKYRKGIQIKKPEVFLQNISLQRYFAQGETTIIVEEMQSNYHNKDTKELTNFLTKLGIEIVVPLNVKNKIIGLLALGAKESGDMYNSEDLQVLDMISAQLGVAINNAQLYTKVKDFNSKLRKEITQATSKLQITNDRLQIMANRLAQANDQLRKLDNAKTEFISIASHQLRTPLTAVKGFVSLLLEGSYGKLSKEIKNTLNKVYLSNERLIQLVEDLLNASKIEAGRMDYQFEKTQLIDVCQELFDTFIIRAKERRLKLELKISSKKIPEVMTDKNKIREVISNLIDNAIKYTLKGRVTVKISLINDRVQVAVTDTGIGVPQEETPYLFQKFSRGKDISRLNTGGTGLGLHVGKKIMEALGGKIWLESAGANKGATFFIEVPIEVSKIKNN